MLHDVHHDLHHRAPQPKRARTADDEAGPALVQDEGRAHP